MNQGFVLHQMETCLTACKPTGGQIGLLAAGRPQTPTCLPAYLPKGRQAGEVTLVPVRLRLWVQRLAILQAFFVF